MSSWPVVVGTDATAHCDEAVRFAAQEALLRDAWLIVVHAYIGPIDPDGDDFETPKEVRVAEQVALTRQALIRALGVDESALPPHRIVVEDIEPSALLVRVAHEHSADLIVVGQQHRALLDRLIHPSHAGALARRSHVPIAVVPERETDQHPGVTGTPT